MVDVSLRLLGPFELVVDGDTQRITSTKAHALLAWLALHEQPQDRGYVATLLWPDSTPQAARQNLRKTVSRLPDGLPIESTRTTLAWLDAASADVPRFERLVTSHPAEAITLWRGELLQGATFSSAELSDWLRHKRETLTQQYRSALTTLAHAAFAAGDDEAALAFARRLLAVDDYDEAAHQLLMQSLARLGRAPEALAHFEQLQQLFADDLQIAPQPETLATAETIRQSITRPQPRVTATPPPQAMPHAQARAAVLHNVQSFWIEGVLHHSLHGQAMIELNKSRKPSALAHPWSAVVRRPQQADVTLATSTHIADLFDSEGRALLILGAPGAGKTTSLLDLAQELLVRAHEDSTQPIPVVLNLATWRGQTLSAWLLSEINEKYLIPRPIAADWLASHALVLLLDGLDEVPREQQAACIDVLNQFRQQYGLTPLAVCCRQIEYESLKTQLNLNCAVVLLPLETTTVATYLGQFGPHVTAALTHNQQLGRLMQSPLMLSMLVLLAGRNSAELSQTSTPSGLFTLYQKQMHNRRPGTFSAEASTRWLSWIAEQMSASNQPIFLLETLQPTWLASRSQRLIYLLSSRLISALLFALALMLRLNPLSDALAFASNVFISTVASDLIFFRLGDKIKHQRLRRIAYTLLISGMSVLLAAPSAGGDSLFLGAMTGLMFGARAPAPTSSKDIRTVEQLSWSWRSFGVGIVAAVVLSPLIFLFRLGDTYAVGTGVATLLIMFGTFGGLLGRGIPRKTLPNQGMRLSLTNACRGAATLGSALFCLVLLVEFVLLRRDAGLSMALAVGAQYGALAALWYGGIDVIKHVTLRLLLTLSGKLPLRAARFLEQSVDQIFLHRAGSGYLFIHPLLRDYFATRKTDTNE